MPNVIEILIKAKDEASKQIQAIGRSLGDVASSFRQIGLTAAAAGGALTGAMTLSAKSAIAFQKGMAEVATLVDESKVSMDGLRDAVLRLSAETGKSLSDVTQALYKVTSAGYEGADAIKFLEVAGKTAVAGVSSLSDAVDVLRTMLASYNLSADQASAVSDKLFKLVDQGIPTFSEWASTIGRVAGTAAQAGIPMDQMLAALASMSKTAPSAAQATTELAAVISSIIKPTDQAMRAAAEMGIQLDASALASKGLFGVLRDVERAVGDNAEALAELFTEEEAFRGVQRLLSGEMKDFEGTLRAMRDSAGSTEEAFRKQSETVAFLLSRIRALGEKGMIQLGSAILPAVRDALSGLLSLLEKVTDFFSSLPDPIQRFISIAGMLAGAIGAITGAAVLLLPQLIAFGKAIMTLLPLLSSLAGPIGIAVAAIGGLATAVVLLIKYWDQVKAGAKGFVEGMKTLFSNLGNWFKSLFSSIGDVFMGFLKMLTIKGAKAGIEQMKAGFAGIGEAVSQAFQTAADVAIETGQAIGSGAVALAKGVKDQFSKLMDGLKSKHEETGQRIEAKAKETAQARIQTEREAAAVSKKMMEQRLKMALENFKFEAQAHNMSIEEQIQALDRMRDEYSKYPDLVQKVDEQIIKLQAKLRDEIAAKIDELRAKRAEATQEWLANERARIGKLEGVYGKYSDEVIGQLQKLYTQAEALGADYYGSQEAKERALADLSQEINRRRAGALKE
ncbi:TPA: phage tail tape measure protein, partial [Candidatus Poribacteria bacterium]|nr:phage tail tape measure protein [Candidatus Poribacteria bacterium]